MRFLTRWTVVVAAALCVFADTAALQEPEEVSAPLQRVLDAFAQGETQDQRILGGTPAAIADHPWQVALVAAKVPVNTKAQFCGGSIIARRWVVTAAHCVDKKTKASHVELLTGTESLLAGGTRIPVVEIVRHADWNPKRQDTDIALLFVGSDLAGTPIKGLASDEVQLATPPDVTVTGWGALAWNARGGSKVLQQVTVPFVVTATCNERASYDKRITPNMFCAGRELGGMDACQGDSGGPATILTPEGRRLLGIVSWGIGCGFPKKYGVYARVSRFAAWVKEKTKGDVEW